MAILAIPLAGALRPQHPLRCNGPMRVLVVEDELKMANLLKSGLAEEGHSVLVANTAPDGLELAAAYDCDVAVLDVMLPGFDGFELVRRMRKGGLRTPVLML